MVKSPEKQIDAITTMRDTTHAVQDYLKVIYKLQQQERPVPTAAIAERLDLSTPAVSKMLKHLTALKLVKHSRYYGVELTEVGVKIALEVIRHHRLIELYLVKALGIPWDRVDAEAEVLEHVLSEELEERMASILGYPTRDPHGDPIPTLDGTLEDQPYKCLSDVIPGSRVQVLRVPDRDPRLLQYLAEIGLVPDADVEIVHREPLDGPLHIRVNSAPSTHVIGADIAGRIAVSS